MIWRVEIKEKDGVYDAFGESVVKDISDLGIKSVKKVHVVHVYMINGDIQENEIKVICQELLADRVTQDYSYCPATEHTKVSNLKNSQVVEIAYNPGVMDPVEESTIKGIKDLGVDGIVSVATAKQYILEGNISPKNLNLIAGKVLSNKLIQHVVKKNSVHPAVKQKSKKDAEVEVLTVDILSASDRELKKLSEEGQLFLNLNEMQVIQKYFKIGRAHV